MTSTILLVDRASCERDIWKSFLEAEGFVVNTADDEQGILLTCLGAPPDLLLLRDTLPDVRGPELCRKLKATPLTQQTPLLLVTGCLSAENTGEGDDFWVAANSRWEVLTRIQSLIHMKAYIDDQANAVLLSLAQSIDATGPGRVGHSERLADYAVQLAEGMGLSERDLEVLRIGCLLHDIGKVAVPDSILNKPGPLTPEEREIVKQHPIVGENICAPLKSLRGVLPIIRHHHERMDGSGYPDGLRGPLIPLKARIMQIADIYDALVSDRPYREALLPEQAMQILRAEARRGWLDMALVRRFCAICRLGFLPKGRSMLASYYA